MTTTHTAYIARKQLHNYLGITSSSPHSITIMRRPGKDSWNGKIRKKYEQIFVRRLTSSGTCSSRVISTQAKGYQSHSHTKGFNNVYIYYMIERKYLIYESHSNEDFTFLYLVSYLTLSSASHERNLIVRKQKYPQGNEWQFTCKYTALLPL